MTRHLWEIAALAALTSGCSSSHTSSTAHPGPVQANADTKSIKPPPPVLGETLPRPAPAGTSALEPTDLAQIRFRDITAETGIDFVHYSGMHPDRPFPTNFGSGVGMLDYDGDGLVDLYFGTLRNFPSTAPNKSHGNRLYRNLGGGRFEDVTALAGVSFQGFTQGVAVGDLDNNGFPDLYLTNFGPNVLYLNNGDGTFRDATESSKLAGPAWSTGAAMLDYDNDGNLDIYVSSYTTWTEGGDHQYCGEKGRNLRIYCPPFSFKPVRHHLYRNRGDGTFEDRTESAGILRLDGRGLGVVTADVNDDGRIDIYVANDDCPNFLFLNRGDGTFADFGADSGTATDEAGRNQGSMGVDAEDVDGDGRPDLLVTNFRGQGNTLYKNLDGTHFQDISALARILKDSRPWVGWGCALTDLDNDGHVDIFVVNGEVDDNLKEFGQDVPFEEPTKVWRNQGHFRFQVVADAGPFFAKGHVGRGAAFGDIDNDGRLDVVINRFDALPAVLINESPERAWIRLELIGRVSNRSAVGATVVVHAGGRRIRRQLKGGGSYLSANDPRLLVGLGAAQRVDRIEVQWPSGARSRLDNPQPGKTHLIHERHSPIGAETGAPR